MKVLMVLTSHDQLGDAGHNTGFWLEELAAPYHVLRGVPGVHVTLASPKGGRPPLDPKSNEPNFQTDITRRFEKDADANAKPATARCASITVNPGKTTIPCSTPVVMDRCGISPKTSTRSGCWNPSWPRARPSRWSATPQAPCVMSETPDGKLLVEGKTIRDRLHQWRGGGG